MLIKLLLAAMVGALIGIVTVAWILRGLDRIDEGDDDAPQD